MLKVIRSFLKICFTVVLLFFIMAVLYLIFISLTNPNLSNSEPRIIKSDSSSFEELEVNKEYELTSQNIMYAIADYNFSSFLEKNRLLDSKKPNRGKSATGVSKEAVENNLSHLINNSLNYSDVSLFQNVDEKSSRSFRVDQISAILKKANSQDSAFLVDTSFKYFPYPIFNPIGRAVSGKLITTNFEISSAESLDLPKKPTIFNQFFEQSYNCEIVKMKVSQSDKQLVIFNVNLSSSDSEDVLVNQMKTVFKRMQEESEKGNFVIAGGSFNLSPDNSVELLKGKQEPTPSFYSLNTELIPAGFKLVNPFNVTKKIGTVRDASIPLKREEKEIVNNQVVADYFFVSNNIEANSKIESSDFQFSTHNLVKLKFKLNERDDEDTAN